MLDIKKGDDKYIDECVVALQDSALGRVYFSQENKALNAIKEGLDNGEIWVAIDDSEGCVGFIWSIEKGAFHSFPYLHIIAVGSKFRNKGIGKELMEYYETIICAGRGKSFLVVADFNPKAKKLYEKIGYKEVGKVDGLYKAGVVEYLMMKILNT